jgi:hypothetical protein
MPFSTHRNDADLLDYIDLGCESCLTLASNLEPKNGRCSAEVQARAEQCARDNLVDHLRWQHPRLVRACLKRMAGPLSGNFLE